jgi:hypothetical protein
MIKMKVIKNWFSRQVEQELEENYELNERVGSIIIAVFTVLSGLYFVAHQMQSTGFFTTKFGILEILMLYGFLSFWFVTSASYSIGRINLSRNVDAFGGCVFATVCIVWLYLVFPFDFTFFADIAPDSLEFLVQWISNNIARVLMVLGFIVHVIFAVYSAIWRVSVLKARSRRNQLHNV